MMDHGACNIIYLDRRAREELVRKDSLLANHLGDGSNATDQTEYFKLESAQPPMEVRSNLQSILSTFNEGMRYVPNSNYAQDTDLSYSLRLPIRQIMFVQAF